MKLASEMPRIDETSNAKGLSTLMRLVLVTRAVIELYGTVSASRIADALMLLIMQSLDEKRRNHTFPSVFIKI